MKLRDNHYPLIECEDQRHMFVQDEQSELWLLDTGCPVTHRNETVQQFVRTELPIAGLIGRDELGQWDIVWDTRAGFLRVLPPGTADITVSQTRHLLPLLFHNHGHWCVQSNVGVLAWDTGAFVTYLRWWLRDCLLDSVDCVNPEAGMVTDFHAWYGDWTSSSYVAKLRLLRSDAQTAIAVPTHCASLPGNLEQALHVAEVQGVLGNDAMLAHHHRSIITTSPRHGLMHWDTVSLVVPQTPTIRQHTVPGAATLTPASPVS